MDVVGEYVRRNPGSRAAYERAFLSLPSGCSRNVLYWPLFPIYLAAGRGTRLWDVDGNEWIDFNFNNTTLILGHNHSAVVAAVEEQLDRGTVLGAPTEAELELAEDLLRRRQRRRQDTVLTLRDGGKPPGSQACSQLHGEGENR